MNDTEYVQKLEQSNIDLKRIIMETGIEQLKKDNKQLSNMHYHLKQIIQQFILDDKKQVSILMKKYIELYNPKEMLESWRDYMTMIKISES